MYKAIIPEESLIEADLREIRGYRINLSEAILQDGVFTSFRFASPTLG